MTIQDILILLGKFPLHITIIFCALPLFTALVRIVQGRMDCGDSSLRYIYTIIIYSVCFPGIISLLLTGYSIFFLKANLLKVNIVIYFLPILSMIVALAIIHYKNSFNDIPGFDKIQGFMIIIGTSFIITLVINKTVIFIGIFLGIKGLIIICIIVFILFKIGWNKLSGRSRSAHYSF